MEISLLVTIRLDDEEEVDPRARFLLPAAAPEPIEVSDEEQPVPIAPKPRPALPARSLSPVSAQRLHSMQQTFTVGDKRTGDDLEEVAKRAKPDAPRVEVPKPEAPKPEAPKPEVPKPTFVEPETPVAEDPPSPLVVLNVPLCAPGSRPGTLEVVFSVARLCEDKYGWKGVHPDARYATEMLADMDSASDEEEEEEEESEEEAALLELAAVAAANERRRKAMALAARKVGKYDVNDPFIDDTEQFWDELAASTKDGFFVYWGPLVDEAKEKRKKR